MNKRIKKLWIKALRSGKYKQARETMKTYSKGNPAYCCLGVLEQLRCDATGDRFQNAGTLATVTSKWAGLDTDDPVLQPHARVGRRYAAELNDSGKDFNFIADRIEKYL